MRNPFRRRNRAVPLGELVAVLDRFTNRPIRIHHHVTREPEPPATWLHITFRRDGVDLGTFTIPADTSGQHEPALRTAPGIGTADRPVTVLLRVERAPR